MTRLTADRWRRPRAALLACRRRLRLVLALSLLGPSPLAPSPLGLSLLGLSLFGPVAAAAEQPVRVQGGWFRYLLASIPAGGYVTLRNAGAGPAVLVGVASPACGMMMLHRTETGGGSDRMVGVRQVTIPAHGTFRFAPGGYHLMCMAPKMHPGQRVKVTLRFADGSHVAASFQVRGANGAPLAPARRGSMKAGAMPMKMSN